ncbi:MAG: decarboxylating 6-phosphogluconate dehydrogenase [Chloroflexi bacterium]|nr:decarboxylating 6-phosphogluconate dehydrogenase [Chloroflexota bacterium]
MELGFVGLGRMGFNMCQRLLLNGHRIVAYNRSQDKVKEIVGHGAEGATSLQDLVNKLQDSPKAIWLMVPSGDVTEQHVIEVMNLLQPGDIIIDGGNSNYKDTLRRYTLVKEMGIHYLDAGTSGGVWGLKNGYAEMVGGDEEPVKHLEPIFRTLAPEGGYLHCGPSGSGHFVKMVHNGIEYGMLAAYGEGYDILEKSRYSLDLLAISKMWQNGSVVRSWLLDLAVLAFEQEGNELSRIKGYVEDSGEGRWTVQEAIDQSTPAPILTLSLLSRFVSRQPESFSAKVIAALRNQFGGHAVQAAGAEEETHDEKK